MKLNKATRNDRFPYPSLIKCWIGWMERSSILYGYSRYNQFFIPLEDYKKTTCICSYGIFAFKRMLFRLSNAPTTSERCMIELFLDLLESLVEDFVDDFYIFGEKFQKYLDTQVLVIIRCERNYLVELGKC